ncbi:U3 small nucleolar RNA-associated protein 25, putative [Plasmodium chabaudi chabaudi]|uniref:U3 small nucleolar RNA-associated protein 25, putative n=1 Tax=Plasmodium chabaudi chabaudi TaxID=31271 RepID=A0A1C6YLT9_PLACU|nr:U3 small nucleolar RNA-associated protein 25, putative [Plasmodium chabaudi chabaudi]
MRGSKKSKRKITSLNELYELEYVKREKKRKLKELKSKINKKNELTTQEDDNKKNLKNNNNEENEKKKKIDKTLLEKYEKLKELENTPTNNQNNETKNGNNKSYKTFLQILQKKNKKIYNQAFQAKSHHTLSPSKQPEQFRNNDNNQNEHNKNCISKNNKDEEKDVVDSETNKNEISTFQNKDEIYMKILINNIKNQNTNFLNDKENDNEMASQNDGHTLEHKDIYADYANKSYKLVENKMDYYFTFCQNIDDNFIKKFLQIKLKKGKHKNDNTELNKNQTVENMYVTSNLFLQTNIFKKKTHQESENQNESDHSDQIDEVEIQNENIDEKTSNLFFNNIKIKPYFFSNYVEKNDITYFLMTILKTHPKSILDDNNYYNIYEPILNKLKIYLSEFKYPLAFFNNQIYEYMQNYYNVDIKKVTKQESDEEYEIDNIQKKKKIKKKTFRDVSAILERDELKAYFHYINSYVDVFYSNQNILNFHFIRLLNSIHCLNHLKKRRKRKLYIKKKIEKLEKTQQVEKENIQLKDDLCDESFSKPKILILCAFRYICKEYVDLLINMLSLIEVKNKNRFINEYDITPEEKKNLKNMYIKKKQSFDYINLYRGNSDDCFRLGIKLFENEKKIQLYSPFYDSDILICSPLGLEIIIKEYKETEDKTNNIYNEDDNYSDDYELNGADNSAKKTKKKKKINTNNNKKKKLYEYDFLSSIEVLVIDQIDIILMQNILTLKNVLNFINKPLLKWRNANINRIAKYAVDGYIKNYRQTIITSSIIDTNFISLIQLSNNYRSFLKLFIKNDDDTILLSIRNMFKINQYFKKIECDDILKIEECIIDFFSTNVIEILTNIKQLIICIPTYIEYIRLYEILKKNDISFKGVNEYTTEKKRIKIQKLFKFEKVNILLVTSRLIYYERCTFKNANHVIFFSPPKFQFMYFELIKNITTNTPNASSMCYYTKYHTYELERIVGQKRAIHLMREKPGKITLFK